MMVDDQKTVFNDEAMVDSWLQAGFMMVYEWLLNNHVCCQPPVSQLQGLT